MQLLLDFKQVPVPLGFENWLTFWLVIVISAVNCILMLFVGYKFMHMLQLSGYKIKDYFVWIKDTKYKDWLRLVMLSALSCAALWITNVLLEPFFIYKILTYLGLLFYFIFCFIYIRNVYNAPQKTPLKYTKRVNRLCVLVAIVVFVLTCAFLMFSYNYLPYFAYGAVGLIPMLMPLVIALCHLLLVPIEIIIANKYIKQAKKILKEHKNLKVIGITGSYGKTSVKNILATMLSVKYNVCATPYSYNTPLGLSKTIIGSLKKDDEFLICEMGAKHIGDIKYLCDMVKPCIGVITGIGNQHLATFGTKQNLIKTKQELALGLSCGGEIYVNTEDSGAMQIYNEANIRKYQINLNNNDEFFRASDISVFERGSRFKLHFGSEVANAETSLLGKHNVANILLCSAVCYNLGLTPKQIEDAISGLVPASHRLAIVPSSNSLVLIDDAYNGSVEGAKAGLEAISHFTTKKIVITPGLVELGSEQFNSNFELGINMAKVCDYVIINGVTNYDAINAGLEFAGFNKENILRAGSLHQSIDVLNTIAKAGDVVLFENDLPDNYV